MDWTNLLSATRKRKSRSTPAPHRNCFDMDYERIASSSSLRRLQDKTQLFPLQENDFTRTRLTHSFEVSSLGRSMGRKIGLQLAKETKMTHDQADQLASLLMVAGLVHDLGNPPFGHYGEKVIKDWFSNLYNKGITFKGVHDYMYFDGNAQTIRILTRLQLLNDKHGVNFCFGTLGTLMKYSWGADNKKAKEKEKFGYFDSERDLAEEIIQATGIITRHPATFLLEAADDIAYRFSDIEDAVKKGCISWLEVYERLKELIKKDATLTVTYEKAISEIDEQMKHAETNRVFKNEYSYISVQNFKVNFQGLVLQFACEEFINNYDAIMEGKYNSELLDNSKTKPIMDFLKVIFAESIFSNKEVMKLELIGRSVMNSLLDNFIYAVLNEVEYTDTKTTSGKLYGIISDNFKYVHYLDKDSKYVEKQLSQYDRVQIVIDYLTGMTDTYAVKLNRQLLGARMIE